MRVARFIQKRPRCTVMSSALQLTLHRINRVLGAAAAGPWIPRDFLRDFEQEYGPDFIGGRIFDKFSGELYVGFVVIKYTLVPGSHSTFEAEIKFLRGDTAVLHGLGIPSFFEAVRDHSIYKKAVNSSLWVKNYLNRFLAPYKCSIDVESPVEFAPPGDFSSWTCYIKQAGADVGSLAYNSQVIGEPEFSFWGLPNTRGHQLYYEKSSDITAVIQCILKRVHAMALNSDDFGTYVVWLRDFTFLGENGWKCELYAISKRKPQVCVGRYWFDGSNFFVRFENGEEHSDDKADTVIQFIRQNISTQCT